MLAIKPHNKKEGTFMDEFITIRRIEESEAVIKANENVVGIGIWNIGNELRHIRDNKTYTQKGYSDFQEYCEKELNYSRPTAYRFIEIADKFPVSSMRQIESIGIVKLLEVAKLPEETRTAVLEHAPLNDMTVKEVQELRKQLQEREKQIRAEAERRETLEDTIKQMSSQIQELKNRPAEVKTVEKVVEKPVIPDDYEQLKQEALRAAKLEEQLKREREEKNNYKLEAQGYKEHIKNFQGKTYSYEAKDLIDFKYAVREFMRKVSHMVYLGEMFAETKESELQKFKQEIDLVEKWCLDMRQALEGKSGGANLIVLEGGYINE